MLFRIVFNVDQRDVGAVYARLKGLRLSNVEAPTPIEIVPEGAVSDLVSLEGRSQITAKEITGMITAGGRSPKSISYTLNKLIKAGAIKRTKAKGVYSVKAPK